MSSIADLRKRLKQVCIRHDTFALEADSLSHDELMRRYKHIYRLLGEALDIAFSDLGGIYNDDVQEVIKEFMNDFGKSFDEITKVMKKHDPELRYLRN